MTRDLLRELDDLLEQRKQADINTSYTAKLIQEGPDAILKKVGEETAEVIIASMSHNNDAIVHEIADLWFHTLVLLKYHGLNSDPILAELERRFGTSGLEEKAKRKG